MKSFLTMKYHFKANEKEKKLLKFLCHISKNIYNCALYELRGQYFKEKKICAYFDLNKIISKNINYHILNTYQSICTIRIAHANMEKFVSHHNEDGSLKKTTIKINDKKDCTKLPKYKKKKALMPLVTDQIRVVEYQNKKCLKLPLSNLTRTSKVFNQIFEDELVDTFIKESELKKSFNIYFKIPKELYDKRIRQFRIIPNKYGDDFYLEFTYEIEQVDMKKVVNKRMSIDLGISNLATCITEDNESFIIDGKKIKSINQFYNKQKAYYQSLLPKDKRTSKRLRRLTKKRNNQIDDYINKAVAILIKKAENLNVDEIIIGYSKGLKEYGIKNEQLKGKDKKRVNQSFVAIPLAKFKDKIILKARRYGIKVSIINEAYTSKASFYDDDKIEKGYPYSGERIKRGLYERNNKQLVNADINGALNIYKKYMLKSNSKNSKVSYLMSRGLTIPSRVLITL